MTSFEYAHERVDVGILRLSVDWVSNMTQVVAQDILVLI